MFEATNHIIAHGHKNCLCWKQQDIRYERKVWRLKKALFENNIEYNENYIFDLESVMIPDGIKIARKLHNDKMPFSAICAANDYIALGIMSELQRIGYSVPEDIAIIGYDNIDEINDYNPPLTTIRQDLNEMAIVS